MTILTDDDGKLWNPDYQERDREVVDYQEYRLPSIDYALRGPAPDLDSDYFSVIGAAQSFGALVPRPLSPPFTDNLTVRAEAR